MDDTPQPANSGFGTPALVSNPQGDTSDSDSADHASKGTGKLTVKDSHNEPESKPLGEQAVRFIPP